VVGLSGAYSTRTLDSSARLNIRSNGTFDIFEDSKTSLTFEFSTNIGTLIDPATTPTTYATASALYEALRDYFFFDLAANGVFLGGLLADVPVAPALYEMYFATDVNTNGIPIWWNGTNWVNATGAIIV